MVGSRVGKNAATARKPDSLFKVLKFCKTAANTAVFAVIHTYVLYSCLSVYLEGLAT